LRVSRAIVRGVVGAPKSRHGARLVPLPHDLASTLRALRPPGVVDDALVFPGRDGAPADVGSLRRRVLVPASERAGLSGVGFHTLRHACASLPIESGLSVLRLQRWMGHHSPAFTLETYGHLIDGDLGPALDLRKSCVRRVDEQEGQRGDTPDQRAECRARTLAITRCAADGSDADRFAAIARALPREG
jgi:hypothetical protein